MLRLVLIALLAQPALALAEPAPVSPGAFRAYAEGHTLYFERDGQPFGAERFEADGRTTWQFADGSCTDGRWRAYGAQVCFIYEPGDEVLCWRVLRDDTGLLARLLGDGPDAGLELRITRRDRAPLLCGEGGPSL